MGVTVKLQQQAKSKFVGLRISEEEYKDLLAKKQALELQMGEILTISEVIRLLLFS